MSKTKVKIAILKRGIKTRENKSKKGKNKQS